MAEFRFTVVVSGSGLTRRGRLKAQDREQARHRLESQGFLIKSLTRVSEANSVVVSGGVFRDSPLQRLSLLLQVHQPRLWTALTLLGLFLTILYWDPGRGSSKIRPYQPYTVVVTGSVEPSLVARVKSVGLRLPELPARFQWTAKDALSSGGQLRLEIPFEASQTPRQCEITIVWSSGEPTHLQALSLQGQPLTAEVGKLTPPVPP